MKSEEQNIHELFDGELSNGIRKIDNIKEELTGVGKTINTYNILRHLSTTYSMLEAYELTKDASLIESSERTFDYALKNAIVYKCDCAYVVDHVNEKEIQLGALGAAILALTKYMQVTNSKKYLDVSRALARGILSTHDDESVKGFVHVWQYATFEVKEKYRIVYYEQSLRIN